MNFFLFIFKFSNYYFKNKLKYNKKIFNVKSKSNSK